jgi:hypothetical protein
VSDASGPRPATTPGPAAAAFIGNDAYDFSVVLGGPLYQMIRRARLSGDALELLRRRVVAISMFVWLPLFVLSVLTGKAWGDAVSVPFLKDIELHIRFLVVIPFLIVAELVVHQRMRPLARQFLERGLIADASRERFDAAVASTLRLRNSVTVEVILVAFVYAVGILYIWPTYIALRVSTWYGAPGDGGRVLTLAGWWFLCISMPLFYFMLMRWYYRLALWIRFVWLVSRCELRLVPTHPDRAAGLGFLAGTVVAFAPLLMAHGALLAGNLANRIFFEGKQLPDFKVEIAIVPVFLLIFVLGPLLLFVPWLAAARRVGLREYGVLAQRYVRAFDDKWLRGGAPPDEAFVGSADIQSLADLGNSFEIVQGLRVVPFSKQTVIQLGVITLLPVAPLLLTMVSLEELVKQLLRVVL